MAFIINKIKSGQKTTDIATSIRFNLASSRFVADVTEHKNKVEIRKVRLTYKKDYCGNHPLPCPVRPGAHRKHPVNTILEGADWVGFNDMVNDVLDKMGCVCDCASSLVVIRKDGKRCTRYDSQPLGNGIDNEWKKDSGSFENGMGRQVSAKYPAGTPGFSTAYGQPNYPEYHHH